ncbi:MAG: hypothetical protein H7336_09110 [Bacteriovorax sp.]|nr:hypothetical protein [Bacteriovorax sp.]
MNDLKNVVDDSRIGKVPCYVNLTNYAADDLETLIINLEQVILTNFLHPRFPYPFYLILGRNVRTIFPSVRSVKDLPEHYFKKVKRPNNKELQLLNKLSLKVDKIKNLELYKISQELKDSADSQKKLYAETKELHFLETLNDMLYAKIKSKTKER